VQNGMKRMLLMLTIIEVYALVNSKNGSFIAIAPEAA
jgi:hypothetical protein